MTTIEEFNVFDFESKAILENIKISEHVIDIPPRTRKMSHAISQLDSCQDSVFTGSYENAQESFDWGIISDGHGKLYSPYEHIRVPFMAFKEAFDALDHIAIVLSEDPVAYIHKMIPFELYPVNVGATLLMFKAFKNRVDIFSVGDSSARVFINKELVYMNELHKIKSDKEVKRLSEQKIHYTVNLDKCHRILDENHLIMEPSSTVTFHNDKGLDFGLSLTQSIGHHGITGFDPERKTIEFSCDDEVQIIIGSDGLFDVVCHEIDGLFLAQVEEADALVKFADSRWKQEWLNTITEQSRKFYMSLNGYMEQMTTLKNVEMPDGKIYYEYERTTFPEYDDISCVVWSQR